MSKLLYIANTSLDGYIEDTNGVFDWGNSDRVHAFAVELLRPIGISLYGRRLYETMTYWDSPSQSYAPEHRDFARTWQNIDKIVYSRTLTGRTPRNTRIERDFDIEAIQKLKRESEQNISIGGAELAAIAIDANLVDECHLLIHPVILGGGKPAFRANIQRNLELLDTRPVGSQVIYARYRLRSTSA